MNMTKKKMMRMMIIMKLLAALEEPVSLLHSLYSAISFCSAFLVPGFLNFDTETQRRRVKLVKNVEENRSKKEGD